MYETIMYTRIETETPKPKTESNRINRVSLNRIHSTEKLSSRFVFRVWSNNSHKKPTKNTQYLVELGWHTKGLIAVTEPRRVAAMTLAERVASERGEILGQTVGVSISFVDRCTEQTHIKVTVLRCFWRNAVMIF